MKTVCFKLEEDLADALYKTALKHNKSISELVREGIRHILKMYMSLEAE